MNAEAFRAGIHSSGLIQLNIYEMFDNNYEYIGKLHVDARDPEKARLIASEIINVFLKNKDFHITT